jgi:hypothetical protein
MSAPTYRSYRDWAQAQGCRCDSSDITRDERVLQALRIVAPSGARVTEILSELDDPVMSTTIARLDRRLGLKSHLFR